MHWIVIALQFLAQLRWGFRATGHAAWVPVAATSLGVGRLSEGRLVEGRHSGWMTFLLTIERFGGSPDWPRGFSPPGRFPAQGLWGVAIARGWLVSSPPTRMLRCEPDRPDRRRSG
jgi:hypothetical protein